MSSSGNFNARQLPRTTTTPWHLRRTRHAALDNCEADAEREEPDLKPPCPHVGALIPTSIVLQRLHDEVTTDHFTLGWLMSRLGKRSFGVIMLLLAVVAIAPGVSMVAGLLLMIPAFQMVMGQPAPVFPRIIAARPLPTRRVAALVQRAVPALKYLEKVIHPRWPSPHETTKRVVGIVVVILNATLVFTPVPLSNVVPAMLIALIALAYLQEDGLLLSFALLLAGIVMTVEFVAVCEMDNRLFLAHLGLSASGNKRRFKSPTFRVRLVSIIRPLGGLDDDTPGRR